MIKTILFDVDGVLAIGKSFAVNLEKEYGISYAMLQPFFTGPFLDATVGIGDTKTILEPYLREWQWPHDANAFLDFWFTNEVQINQQLVDYIQVLRAAGTKCYLATNQEQYRTAYLWDRIKLNELFDGRAVSYELGFKKPDILFFEKAHQKIGGNLVKNEIIFWDDLSENVDAARAYGIHAEHYTSFDNFKTKMEQYV